MSELGRAALTIALGLSLYALVAGGYAAYAPRRRPAASAQNALLAAFAATAVAARAVLAAPARPDFAFV